MSRWKRSAQAPRPASEPCLGCGQVPTDNRWTVISYLWGDKRVSRVVHYTPECIAAADAKVAEARAAA
ncbi:MAG: hypothetical protein AAFR11_05540 [Pseudomonadota bacterium]